MTTTHENAPVVNPAGATAGDEGIESHLTDGLHLSVAPTSVDVADLLRDMPGPGAPEGERVAWVQRKHELLARIEEAKR